MGSNHAANSKTLNTHALLAGLGVAVLVWAAWYLLAGPNPMSLVREHWPVSLTMVFGSLIAGATSEGGGAVAFPVFTKVLGITPTDAKVFALAIQSVGMTAASVVIIAAGIKIEWRVIAWVTLGGILGIVLGATVLAPLIPPPIVRMLFTMMASSLALTLYLLNRQRGCYHARLPVYESKEKCLLMVGGLLGGMLSGLVGSGIDIVAFSLMVLLFRIGEKVATPTSVIIMALNAVVGFLLHWYFIGGFTEQVRDYWLAAIPVVVVGAPLGAIFCSLLNNATIAWILIGLIAIELVTSLLLIPLTPDIGLFCVTVFLLFFLSSTAMYRTKAYENVGVL